MDAECPVDQPFCRVLELYWVEAVPWSPGRRRVGKEGGDDPPFLDTFLPAVSLPCRLPDPHPPGVVLGCGEGRHRDPLHEKSEWPAKRTAGKTEACGLLVRAPALAEGCEGAVRMGHTDDPGPACDQDPYPRLGFLGGFRMDPTLGPVRATEV